MVDVVAMDERRRRKGIEGRRYSGKGGGGASEAKTLGTIFGRGVVRRSLGSVPASCLLVRAVRLVAGELWYAAVETA